MRFEYKNITFKELDQARWSVYINRKIKKRGNISVKIPIKRGQPPVYADINRIFQLWW